MLQIFSIEILILGGGITPLCSLHYICYCKNPLFIHIAHALTTIQKAYFNTWFAFQV